MYKAKKGDSLLLSLAKAHSSLDAFCGGRGTCGKCKIKLVDGNLTPTDTEIKKLTKSEIEQGVRLACLHTCIEEDVSFVLVQDNSNFVIEGNKEVQYPTSDEEGYVVAVDIGTTTVVMDLLHLQSGKVEKEIRFMNPQKLYGADVISRVDSVRVHGVKAIQSILLDKMEEALHTFHTPIKRMSVCGNAVMTHLFLGADPSSIAQAPYTCVVNEYVEVSSKTLFPSIDEFVVQVLPPISAFVGSDIVMDLYDTKMLEEENTLLIDLGTNGEIALVKDGKLLVSSAACGPAFEGGNMSCGCGAIAGAIDHASFKQSWHYTTILNKKPCGICGSGYMAMISSCLENGFIDETGFMEEDIELYENVVLTQKDIREFQLAKSAIASACKILCINGNAEYKEIKKLYIAGGFGTHINKYDLAVLGIIPRSLLPRLVTLGNSAIRGCCRYAILQEKEEMLSIVQKGETINLAMDPKFSDEFMLNMMFEDVYEN